jgi:hypothetical protein
MNTVNELTQLLPEPRTINVGGEAVEVWPIRVRQLARVLPAIEALNQVVSPSKEKAQVPEQEGLTDSADAGKQKQAWLALLLQTQHAETVIELICAAIEKPREWADPLDLAELFEVAGAVIEVNADFFIHRLGPAINAITARILSLVPGHLLSSDSSPPITASAM